MWQTLYEALRERGFVIISVAMDTAGVSTAKPWIDAAQPSYPCLIDPNHLVSELYDMVNVPSGVWIDEEGFIVRPSEVAGWSDAWRTGDKEELARLKQVYYDAVRDWVENGAESEYASVSNETSPNDPVAAAHFRMGVHLASIGAVEVARLHFTRAIELQPDSWNYKRQAWSLTETTEEQRRRFLEAIRELGERAYYPMSSDIYKG